MRVYSITYQSFLDPAKVYMFSGVFGTPEQAFATAEIELKQQNPGVILKPLMLNTLELPDVAEQQRPLIDEYKNSKNWVMKTIIDNKDLNLFTASSTYLSKEEKLYVFDKTGFIISEGIK